MPSSPIPTARPRTARRGRLVTLEYAAAHAKVARGNIARAGLAAQVEIRVVAALDNLPGLTKDAPFDFIFIDADKVNNPAYLDRALRLTRPGGVIVRGRQRAGTASRSPS